MARKGLIRQKQEDAIRKETKFNSDPNYKTNYQTLLKEGLQKMNSGADGENLGWESPTHAVINSASALGRYGLALRTYEKELKDREDKGEIGARDFVKAAQLAKAGGYEKKADKYVRAAMHLAENNSYIQDNGRYLVGGSWDGYEPRASSIALEFGYLKEAADYYKKHAQNYLKSGDRDLAERCEQVSRDLRSRVAPKDASSRVAVAASVIGLIGGAFFFSNGVTGNAISNLSNTTSSWIGGVLFCIGLVSCFFWIKVKK